MKDPRVVAERPEEEMSGLTDEQEALVLLTASALTKRKHGHPLAQYELDALTWASSVLGQPV